MAALKVLCALMASTLLGKVYSLPNQSRAAALAQSVDESQFSSVEDLRRDVDLICSGGLRMPGGELHQQKVDWIKKQLLEIPGLTLEEQPYDLLAWEPRGGKTLKGSGKLSIGNERVKIASTVAYSKPTGPEGVTGPLVYIPLGTNITAANAKGKIVVRDIDYVNYPYLLLAAIAYNTSGDFDLKANYTRPSVAPTLLLDLANAGPAGALGIVTVYNVPRKQMRNIFTPHDGTHFLVPALFTGVDEGVVLKEAAKTSQVATMSVDANVYNATTKNIIATLPGQSPEKVVYVTHTDGVTYVQENGAAPLLALARYFAQQPLEKRTRTLQFAFNTGHLHLSREGSDMLSRQFNDDLDTNNVTLVIPVEHMATKEVETFPRANGPGSDLRYTGEGEALIWCVGPMPPVIAAARAAFARRALDKTFLMPGASVPQTTVVPTYTSFGGLGTYFHTRLVPTTSMISGPYSLWAPYFGRHAVDYDRMRAQTLALGDLYYGVQDASRAEIMGEYADYRALRANGTKAQYQLYIPPETIS